MPEAAAGVGRPGLVATMAACMGIGPLLLYGLSAMSPLVISDLHLSRTQFGAFAATAFAAAALVSGPVGRFVDRCSARTSLAILFVGVGVAIGVAAGSRTYQMLIGAVVVSGAAQALSNPVTNRLVTTYSGPGARGLMMGLKQAGVQMAQFLAAVALPPLAAVLGWRDALAVSSALAVGGLAVSRLAVPRVAPGRAVPRPSGRGSGALPVSVWWLAAYALITGAAMQAVNVYLPLYAYQGLHLPLATAALTAAVVGGAGLVARVCWGHAADRARSTRKPLVLLGGVAAVGSGTVLAGGVVHASALLWVGVAVFGATGIAANVVLMVGVVREVPPAIVGRATGVLAMGLYLGFASGPLAFGALVDATENYGVGWAAVTVAYVLSSCLMLFVGRARGGALVDAVPPRQAQACQ